MNTEIRAEYDRGEIKRKRVTRRTRLDNGVAKKLATIEKKHQKSHFFFLQESSFKICHVVNLFHIIKIIFVFGFQAKLVFSIPVMTLLVQ